MLLRPLGVLLRSLGPLGCLLLSRRWAATLASCAARRWRVGSARARARAAHTPPPVLPLTSRASVRHLSPLLLRRGVCTW